MNIRITTKYIVQTFVVVVIIYVITSGLFTFATDSYAHNDQKSALSARVDRIAASSQMFFIHGHNEEDNVDMLNMLASSMQATVFIVSVHGEVLMTSSEMVLPCGTCMPQSATDTVLQGYYSGEGEISGITNDLHFLSGRAVYDDFGEILGSVFLAARPEGSTALVTRLTRAFTVAAFTVMSLTLMVFFFTLRRMTTPLRSMSDAARRFGRGEFDVRVDISGDDEVAELAVAFNNMADSLGRTEEMRRSFIANVSHDLKTPMTTISGFVDGILDGTIPKEDASRYLGLVSGEVRRLSRLVTTLLDLARLESEEMEFKMNPFDLCEAIRQVLISFEKTISAKELSLKLNLACDEISAKGDQDAIYRVLYNIIDNAIKFTPEKGELTITLEKQDKMARCTVKNTGEGLTEEDVNLVFHRFYKSDKSRSLNSNGSGLGLYIAKSILERHGGGITAESVYGEYAAFIFTIPLTTTGIISLMPDFVREKDIGMNEGDNDE